MKYFCTVLILTMLIMLAPLSIDTYLPSFFSIAADLDVPISSLQLSIAIFSFCSAFSMLISGVMSDIFGRRKIILISLCLFLLVSAAITQVSSIWWFLALRALQGICAGSSAALARSIVQDLYRGVQAQKAMALMTLLFGFAPIIAPILGGQLENIWGWHAVFFFLCIFAATIFTLFALFVPESLPVEQRKPLNLSSILGSYALGLKNSNFLIRNFAIALILTPVGIFLGSVPYLAVNVLHLNSTEFGWLFIPMISGGMIGSIIASKLAGSRLEPQLLKISLAITLGITIMASSYISSRPATIALFALPWFCFTFSFSLIMPKLVVTVLNLLDRQSQGLASSLQSFFQTLFFALTIGVLAPLISNNTWLIYTIAGSLSSSGIILWLICNKILAVPQLSNLNQTKAS